MISQQLREEIEAAVAGGAPGDPESLTYQIKPNADVGIIGVGGGIDVAGALAHGARSVYGVELNPATYRYAEEIYADYNGDLMDDPRVTLVNAEGRNALQAVDREFDVIQVIAIDTFAALSSGPYVLSENYLYTVEAFEDLFGRLKPDGILAYYRWLFMPPRETLRLSAVACEAWQRRGIDDCSQHIIVVGRDGWALSLFKQTPFTLGEVEKLNVQAAAMGLWVLHWPKIFPAAEQGQLEAGYYAAADPALIATSQAFTGLTTAYREGREAEFFASHQYNIAPTTDDSPFFFEYHRLNALGLPSFFGGHTGFLRSGNVGTTLFIIIAEATLLSLVAIFWPLWRYQRAGLRVPHAAAYSLYFAALGIGFMMIEIAVIQKAVLLLGNPLYALPVVLATLLVSAGVGSWVVARTGARVRRVTGPVGVLFLGLVALLIVGLTPLFRELLYLSFAQRVGVTVLVLAPLGLLMGMFFPTGLRAVGEEAAGFISWAWGINGCTSVYGSVVAILVAMAFSFNVTLAIGGGGLCRRVRGGVVVQPGAAGGGSSAGTGARRLGLRPGRGAGCLRRGLPWLQGHEHGPRHPPR